MMIFYRNKGFGLVKNKHKFSFYEKKQGAICALSRQVMVS